MCLLRGSFNEKPFNYFDQNQTASVAKGVAALEHPLERNVIMWRPLSADRKRSPSTGATPTLRRI